MEWEEELGGAKASGVKEGVGGLRLSLILMWNVHSCNLI